MQNVLLLLSPRIRSFANRARNPRKGGRARIVLFSTLGVLFWAGLFWVSLKLLFYFDSIEEIGDILSAKLLSMVLVIYFSLLVFSSLLSALSKLYLAKDLMLVHSLPVPPHEIFTARWLETTIDSAWMIILYSLPVLISYGIVFQAPAWYYPWIMLVLVMLSACASLVSSMIVMMAVIAMPPGRIKTIFVFLGLVLFLLLYVAFRLIKPERFVDPEAFRTVLVYLQSVSTPQSLWLPSTWGFDTLMAALTRRLQPALFNIAILATGTCFLFCIAVICADLVYFPGMSSSQTSRKILIRTGTKRPLAALFLSRPKAAFVAKEVKSFLRDQTQWSQVFLIGALVFIYVYNFKVLPLERAPIKTVYLQNILAFLNMGLAAFVLTAVCGRFAYPAVSLEGDAFWLVRAAPVSISSVLWIKFFVYAVPMLIVTEILVISTNLLLKVSPLMMAISTATIFFCVPAVVALAIGLGAAYPDFNAENPAQAVTSFGGLLFMILSALYVIFIILMEAEPVYRIFLAQFSNTDLPFFTLAWAIFAFCIVITTSVAVTLKSMSYGAKRLEQCEF